MSDFDFERLRFELDKKVKLEEIELKKKDLELKLMDQRRAWTSAIPLVLGVLTIAYSAYSLFHQNDSNIKLEDKKLQSSLIIEAVEQDNYSDFAERIDALDELGLIKIDSSRLAKFKQKRFVMEANKLIDYQSEQFDSLGLSLENLYFHDYTSSEKKSNHEPAPDGSKSLDANEVFFWMIVAGGDKNLEGAQFELKKAQKAGFKDIDIWLKQNSFRTVIGKYNSYQSALEDLFIVKEKINKTAYVVQNTSWCENPIQDESRGIFLCQ